MSSGAIAGSRDSPNKKSAPVDETGSGVESYAGISVFLLYHSTAKSRCIIESIIE